LEDILEEASSQMKQIMLQGDKQWEEEELNQISSIVGLSAIIVQDLQAKRIKVSFSFFLLLPHSTKPL